MDYSATVTKFDLNNSELSSTPLTNYVIKYHDLPRSLSITFSKEFPFEIIAWEETYQSKNDNRNDDLLVTKAVRTNKLMLDYWSKNSVADSVYRHELGLQQ
jgi:hypothetical protein